MSNHEVHNESGHGREHFEDRHGEKNDASHRMFEDSRTSSVDLKQNASDSAKDYLPSLAINMDSKPGALPAESPKDALKPEAPNTDSPKSDSKQEAPVKPFPAESPKDALKPEAPNTNGDQEWPEIKNSQNNESEKPSSDKKETNIVIETPDEISRIGSAINAQPRNDLARIQYMKTSPQQHEPSRQWGIGF